MISDRLCVPKINPNYFKNMHIMPFLTANGSFVTEMMEIIANRLPAEGNTEYRANRANGP